MINTNRKVKLSAININTTCIADKIRLISRVVTSIYDDALRPLGITLNQLNLIVVVARFEPTSPDKVGEWLHMKKSTVSRNINLMSRNGWLKMKPLGQGRSLEIRLLGKGREILKKSIPHWEKAQGKVDNMLKKQGVEELKRIARNIRGSSI